MLGVALGRSFYGVKTNKYLVFERTLNTTFLWDAAEEADPSCPWSSDMPRICCLTSTRDHVTSHFTGIYS